ncbi:MULTISPECIES: urease accessory protein UreF [Lederbergia]|uniref:Urease accessory protein UreF n=3 Tax=Lederbergia TaxID=2804231 RepID=A0A178A012_9BACI|nr:MULTISPECIES: urease accessory protein UreF [Lederbergia]KRG13118.1 urease accessory protein UreF [Virgibacillus soli]MBP1916422.1 urease accessory protein [Lederbergia galactosidilytica]OAK73495.1 urease accessory protein UreF [Lederbergia galactosidilytica]GIN59473.1 urease accessory protein UreF [Lederbergia ruris]
MNNALTLFQLCDSNFPTGAFSHSFGLESYIQKGTVHNADTFSEWLQVYLHEQLVYSDGLAAALVYDALEQDDLETVWKFDRLLTVQNLARETREGTQRIGERLLKITETLYEAPILAIYLDRIKKKQSYGHPALVFIMVGHFLRVDKDTILLYYLYSTIASLVQNAVRAIPLGQTTGQKIIYNFQTELTEAVRVIHNLREEDFGVVSPGLELSQMQHERVNIRIFMS